MTRPRCLAGAAFGFIATVFLRRTNVGDKSSVRRTELPPPRRRNLLDIEILTHGLAGIKEKVRGGYFQVQAVGIGSRGDKELIPGDTCGELLASRIMDKNLRPTFSPPKIDRPVKT
ncbi:hypothetical protein KM043_005081 [Ampulex compressa]|nr:hypothetical protein KM043_005081 [Ampulex compressa]